MFFCFVFFCFFFVRQKYETTENGCLMSLSAERIFMKLLPNDTGENEVCNAAWRMANVDDLRNLRYDSGAITRGRYARRLRYKIMSGRMDLI